MIKNCPFCLGSTHVFLRSGLGDSEAFGFDVCCETDGCYLSEGADWYFDTEQEAIDKWNTRKLNGE